MANKKPQTGRNQVSVFVDTNIYLDYYRSANEANFQLLERLEKVKDRIICTYQVEMEFLKNRQKVLLDSVKEMQAPKQPSIPAILKERKVGKAVKAKTDEATQQTKLLREQVRRLLDKPSESDTVFKTLEGVFQSQSDMVLTRDMPERQGVKRRGLRRFLLGYPPRKKTDTAYGDAINWEWIIEVANRVPGKLVIVSRDSDFGCTHDKEHFLNDQLRQEYKDRVGVRRQLIYTQKLSDALKLLNVKVTEKEVEAESDLMQTIQVRRRTMKKSSELSDDEFSSAVIRKLLTLRSKGDDEAAES